ncbi:MAG: phosphatase PAP2 family protein [Gemmatimonadota bacterium]
MPSRIMAILTTASLIGFLVLVLLLGRLSAFDDAGLRAFAAWRTPALTRMMQGVSWLGSGAAEFPFAFGVTGLLLWRGGKRQGAEYFGWALAGWICYAILKVFFHRHRPDLVERLSGAGWYSFPSGHAMLAPIIYVFAAVMLEQQIASRNYQRVMIAAGWLLALLIAFSRVYLGVHYPTDVLAGLLAGSGWLGVSLLVIRRRELRQPVSK